jgi:adenylate kinase family enzyme
MRILFVSGAPGSGKSTVCRNLCEVFPHNYVSCGDLVRRLLSSDDPRKIVIRNAVSNGLRVPSEIVVNLLMKELEKLKGTDKVVLVDGFPASPENWQTWKDKTIDTKDDSFNVIGCLKLDSDACSLKSRMIARGRVNENGDIIHKRIKAFYDSADLMYKHMAREIDVRDIDASRVFSEVWVDVIETYLALVGVKH